MNTLQWVLGGTGVAVITVLVLLYQLSRAKLKTAHGEVAQLKQLNTQLQNTITALRKQQEVTIETLKQIQAAQSKADAAADNAATADLNDLLDFMRN